MEYNKTKVRARVHLRREDDYASNITADCGGGRGIQRNGRPGTEGQGKSSAGGGGDDIEYSKGYGISALSCGQSACHGKKES